MPIKSNNENLISVAVTDTTGLNPKEGRASITFAAVKNNGVGGLIEAFKSNNATSASGELIYSKNMAAGEEDSPVSLLTTIPINNFLVIKAVHANMIVDLSFTQYSGDD